ncbi:fibrocystin-L, partial [Brachionus plicatilis]
ITINGDGFDQSTKVVLDSLVYDSSNSKITFDSFKFITLANTGQHNLSMFTSGREVEFMTSLTYEFSEAKNPQISSISISEIEQESNLTIIGINFGVEPSEIDLKIGTQICRTIDLQSTTITCTIPGLESGFHIVTLNVRTIGDSNEFNERITGKATVKSIVPNSGSTNGGTIVKIQGNGFTVGSSVVLGQAICLVKNVKINEIE